MKPIHLSLGPSFSLELGNGPQHMKQQASGGITGVEVLIEDLEVDLFAVEFGGNLAQMQRGAGEPIQARDHERVAFPNIFQTRL